ncbi:MAG: 16S rRNA (adenine(1518)-N(6)/adenine(1519)-N(6)) -dimethyltransferase RsmA [Acidimicrobiales bacterium]
MTLSRRDVAALLDDHGLAPSRALGQNFVVDPNTVRRIARLASVGPGDQVVEIGAGLGSLTLALAETGAAVTAVEVDRGIVPVLRTVVEPVGVRVIEADAMTVDWVALLGVGPWTLVANLPYNVATPLVVTLLEQVPSIARMLVMVQAEVGDRLAAEPGAQAFGAVSVIVSYWATAKVVGRVPPTVFLPKPKVDSALVMITRREAPGLDPGSVSYARFKEVVRTGFGQRRKMLRRSLAAVVDVSAFEASDVRPEARAEELGLLEWGRLAAWKP